MRSEGATAVATRRTRGKGPLSKRDTRLTTTGFQCVEKRVSGRDLDSKETGSKVIIERKTHVPDSAFILNMRSASHTLLGGWFRGIMVAHLFLTAG